MSVFNFLHYMNFTRFFFLSYSNLILGIKIPGMLYFQNVTKQKMQA